MLCNWICPQIITDEDYVCEACGKLLINAVNQNLQQNTGNEPQAGPTPRQRGHTNVCILCGCSLIQRQIEKILRDNPSELQRQMIEIIKCRKEPQQVTTSDNVCYACWLRTKIEVLCMNRLNELRVKEAIQHGDDDASHIEPPNKPTVVEYDSMPKLAYLWRTTNLMKIHMSKILSGYPEYREWNYSITRLQESRQYL